jgi:hypothetical protein
MSEKSDDQLSQLHRNRRIQQAMLTLFAAALLAHRFGYEVGLAAFIFVCMIRQPVPYPTQKE